jgi:ADP-ribosylglycohydrolase
MGMIYRNDNMLLRIAQADAYASAIEYVSRQDHHALFNDIEQFNGYCQNPRYDKLKPGMYTDDTQQSCAVSNTLIRCGLKAKQNDFRDDLYYVFKNDPRDGYSRGFQSILELSESPEHMSSLLKPCSSNNGAMMRSVPLGVIENPFDVIQMAIMQASVTHMSAGGINSSVSTALMSHYALYVDKDFSEMYEWCCQWSQAHEYFKRPWNGPVAIKTNDKYCLGNGMCTAWAVQTLLCEENSLMNIMKRIISWGGDTDTVAAVAWGIASCRYQDEKLPEFFIRDLEKNSTINRVDYLVNCGCNLMNFGNKNV